MSPNDERMPDEIEVDEMHMTAEMREDVEGYLDVLRSSIARRYDAPKPEHW